MRIGYLARIAVVLMLPCSGVVFTSAGTMITLPENDAQEDLRDEAEIFERAATEVNGDKSGTNMPDDGADNLARVVLSAGEQKKSRWGKFLQFAKTAKFWVTVLVGGVLFLVAKQMKNSSMTPGIPPGPEGGGGGNPGNPNNNNNQNKDNNQNNGDGNPGNGGNQNGQGNQNNQSRQISGKIEWTVSDLQSVKALSGISGADRAVSTVAESLEQSLGRDKAVQVADKIAQVIGSAAKKPQNFQLNSLYHTSAWGESVARNFVDSNGNVDEEGIKLSLSIAADKGWKNSAIYVPAAIKIAGKSSELRQLVVNVANATSEDDLSDLLSNLPADSSDEDVKGFLQAAENIGVPSFQGKEVGEIIRKFQSEYQGKGGKIAKRGYRIKPEEIEKMYKLLPELDRMLENQLTGLTLLDANDHGYVLRREFLSVFLGYDAISIEHADKTIRIISLCKDRSSTALSSLQAICSSAAQNDAENVSKLRLFVASANLLSRLVGKGDGKISENDAAEILGEYVSSINAAVAKKENIDTAADIVIRKGWKVAQHLTRELQNAASGTGISIKELPGRWLKSVLVLAGGGVKNGLEEVVTGNEWVQMLHFDYPWLKELLKKSPSDDLQNLKLIFGRSSVRPNYVSKLRSQGSLNYEGWKTFTREVADKIREGRSDVPSFISNYTFS